MFAKNINVGKKKHMAYTTMIAQKGFCNLKPRN